jgi:hypothetical protein
MLISNIKSFADLNAKKNLQKQLLEVEANNELENQRRMQDFQNPYIPKPVPQQEKTSSELRKDRQFNEQEARKNLESFNMNYQDTSAIIIWLDNNNRLIDFNANFKGIKKDIEQNYNPKLVSPQWFENYLERYFEEVDVNYGRKMESGDKELPLANNWTELKTILPDVYEFNELNNILDNIDSFYYNKNNDIINLINSIKKKLSAYEELIFDKNLEKIVSIGLNQKERTTFVKRYGAILKNMNYINVYEMRNYYTNLNIAFDNRDVNDIETILNTLNKQLFNITREKELNSLIDLYKKTVSLVNNTPDLSNDIENFGITIEQISNLSETVGGAEAKKEVSDKLTALFNKKQITDNDIKELQESVIEENIIDTEKKIFNFDKFDNFISSMIKDKDINITENQDKDLMILMGRIRDIYEYIIKGEGKNIYQRENDIKLLIFQKLMKDFNIKFKTNIEKEAKKISSEKISGIIEERNIEAFIFLYFEKVVAQILKLGDYKYNNFSQGNLTIGLGLKDKMHKHFVEDEKMLKKVVKELSDSESDKEAEKELMRHIKATKSVDKKIDKKLGQGGQYLPKKDRDAIYSGLNKIGLGSGKVDKNTFKFLGKAESWHDAFSGVGFKATKIKVGKGIAYEQLDNPTYREFGKYRIHIPNLVEKNIANFKYPSLAVIQSIKPLLITDDYKEFLIDVLKNGNINERHYKSLQPDERKHFERVSSGAGLIHKFKLTLNNEEEDIKDADRFNVLRGEYLAGNNNENMIKELRKLIVKFLNNGRISKNEGMNLLMELSI